MVSADARSAATIIDSGGVRRGRRSSVGVRISASGARNVGSFVRAGVGDGISPKACGVVWALTLALASAPVFATRPPSTPMTVFVFVPSGGVSLGVGASVSAGSFDAATHTNVHAPLRRRCRRIIFGVSAGVGWRRCWEACVGVDVGARARDIVSVAGVAGVCEVGALSANRRKRQRPRRRLDIGSDVGLSTGVGLGASADVHDVCIGVGVGAWRSRRHERRRSTIGQAALAAGAGTRVDADIDADASAAAWTPTSIPSLTTMQLANPGSAADMHTGDSRPTPAPTKTTPRRPPKQKDSRPKA